MPGPIDRRLLSLKHVRGLLVGAGALTVLHLAALITQALALATLLGDALGGSSHNAVVSIVVLVVAVLVRTLVAQLSEMLAGRAAGSVASELRGRVLVAVAGWTRRRRAAADLPALLPVMTSGIDGVELYLGRYLPALVQSAIVPVTMVVTLLLTDPVSAVIVMATLPLVPIFMAMVGMYTRTRTKESLEESQRLSGRFADVMAGLPDLVVFSRVRAQAAAITDATERYRRAAMGTLRTAFLSSMVLELISSLAVALVAVTCGLRLVSGSLDLRTALIVLLLAPEAFLPLRAVGASFHSAVDGAVAVATALDLVNRPTAYQLPTARRRRLVSARDSAQARIAAAPPGIELHRAVVRYPGTTVGPFNLRIRAGTVTVLMGPSGIGKSTALGLIAGLDRPDQGTVLVDGRDPSQRLDDPTQQTPGWCGQDVALRRTTLRQALTGGAPVDEEKLEHVINACRFTEVVDGLPDGLDTLIGPGARDLSTGQRRRLGLVRALVGESRLVLLDEPTAGLDDETEAVVVDGLRMLLRGRTAVITTHRSAVLELAHTVVELGGVTV